MKVLCLLLCSLFASQAASLSVQVPVQVVTHPVQSFKTSTKATVAMFLGSLTLEGANAADYATTRLGAYPYAINHNSQLCELNSIYRITGDPCRISEAKFTLGKSLIAAFGVAQWIPVWTGHAGNNYKLTMSVIDLGIGIPLATVDVFNVKILKKYGVL